MVLNPWIRQIECRTCGKRRARRSLTTRRQVIEYGSPSLGVAPLADLMHSVTGLKALWSP